MQAFLNDQFLPLEECSISVLDRGFLFGDGIYELIPCYGRKPFRLDEHLQRLRNSLASVRIDNPYSDDRWNEIIHTLISESNGEDFTVYLQVTRGVAPRDHAFPKVRPTVFAMANPLVSPGKELLDAGVAAVTMQDIRWHRCDIKAIALLPNILSRQAAVDQGATEAILIRDGYATEGAASNLFIVKNGVVVTPPKSEHLLPGITRDLVLEMVAAHNHPYEEIEIPEAWLDEAEEIWITSSSKEILPVTELNQQAVGDGKPGPVWSKAHQWLQEYKITLRNS